MNISNAIIGNRIENPQAQGFQSIKSNDFMKSLANIMSHDVMRYSIPDQYCSDLYMEDAEIFYVSTSMLQIQTVVY